MGKSLSDMTLKELWDLFPISLAPHDDRWAAYYEEMEQFLEELLADMRIIRISHIGSTAVHGIWAKNIIDILLELDTGEDMDRVAETLEDHGFLRMSAGDRRISMNRGYTENGYAEKVYHVHLRYSGDHEELYFRDFLNEHSQVAKEYEQLKLDLWKQFEHDRDAYTKAKSEFVKKWTAEAKKAVDKYR